MLYSCKFHDNISKGFSGNNFYTKIILGYNSIKYVDGVIVLIFCTSSDDALYLYQIS